MSKGKMIFIVVVVLLLGLWLWPSGKEQRIVDVVDGNTLSLSSGARVRLIGVTSTMQGQQYLQGFKGRKVKLRPDGSARFRVTDIGRGDLVYAYVIDAKGLGCLNANMLKMGIAIEEDAYLNDSLQTFKTYAPQANGL